jgi:DNA-directed RNA polymerase specialized sigma24 family protein
MLTSKRADGVLKSLSDETLMEMVATRDHEGAFTELWRRWFARLRGYLLRRTGVWHVADTLAAQTMADLYRKRRAYPAGCLVRNWFFAFAKNVLRTEAQVYARRRVHAGLTVDIRDQGPTPLQVAEANERDGRLHTRLCWLPPIQKDAVHAFLEGGNIGRSPSTLATVEHVCEKLRSDSVLAAMA